MEPKRQGNGMLEPYRVLDLAGEAGILAGKILADLGADVLAVEPPAIGNPVRRLSPFYNGIPHHERSLVWWAHAAGKRGITLNIEMADGQALLKKLIAKTDFLLESFSPGHMDSLGLGFKSLEEINPSLIMVSMTPFGMDGPYARYQWSDLIGMATGGFMHLTGDPDRPPLRVSIPQFGSLLGASGAAGAMISHHYRILTGEGQHVDVSGQQAVARTLSHAPMFWDMNHINLSRHGAYRPMAGDRMNRVNWPCKDGYVNFTLSAGPLGNGTNNLMNWMNEEGFGDDFLISLDWRELDINTLTQGFMRKIDGLVERFFRSHTKDELYQGALARRMLLFPVNTPKDIRGLPQLQSREHFSQIEHPEEGVSFDYPGGFIRSSQTEIGPQKRAPFLGENNREVYVCELGFTTDEMVVLHQQGAI